MTVEFWLSFNKEAERLRLPAVLIRKERFHDYHHRKNEA